MFSYTRAPYDPIQALGLFRRRMDHIFRDFDSTVTPTIRAQAWPQMTLTDDDEAYVVRAAVPGLKVEEIDVRATSEGVMIAGERSVKAPEGYSVHRQERVGAPFSRSITLPTRIVVDEVTAAVKDGILTVTLPKHEESRPRAIKVNVH